LKNRKTKTQKLKMLFTGSGAAEDHAAEADWGTGLAVVRVKDKAEAVEEGPEIVEMMLSQ
jgi:hypothetical protein